MTREVGKFEDQKRTVRKEIIHQFSDAITLSKFKLTKKLKLELLRENTGARGGTLLEHSATGLYKSHSDRLGRHVRSPSLKK